ncbi:MAG: hypothetical protein HY399_01590, partial [Elusimicrobia bacterium]|nr:hypothetical protein [Elusimicrobiota bacterium]
YLLNMRCLGIFRELLHSPHRETDDALILKGVLEELSGQGVQTAQANPEHLDTLSLDSWDVLLPMCESTSALHKLIQHEERHPGLFINSPRAVRNCYRTYLVPILTASSEIAFPATVIRTVGHPAASQIPSESPSAYWMKRGDVHNTCDRDVVFISTSAECEAIRQDFARRSIQHFILQTHIPGDLIKFYGVGPGKWFTWFYHNPHTAQHYPFDSSALDRMTQKAATALGLEVFGGDAIATENGNVVLIDVNSWPSFARVRMEAKKHIANHILDKISRRKSLGAVGAK